jgi:hypothetical protein
MGADGIAAEIISILKLDGDWSSGMNRERASVFADSDALDVSAFAPEADRELSAVPRRAPPVVEAACRVGWLR